MNNNPKIQHYVPQFILKNFTSGKKPQVWVFDKKTNKKFRSNIKNIAAERKFYNFKFEGYELSIEKGISEIEKIASVIINDIIDNEKISDINDDRRAILSYFFAIQLVRTKSYREQMKDFGKLFIESIKKWGYKPEQIEGYEEFDEDKFRQSCIKSIMQSHELGEHFYNKEWILLKTDLENSFYISDNPITLQNMNDYGPRGNIGLAVKGIEIYFPLSNTLTLSMICPSKIDEMTPGYNKYRSMINKYGNKITEMALKNLGLNFSMVNEFVNNMNNGIPVNLSEKNVENLNYLQVLHAERYIFSYNDNFDLAIDMLKDKIYEKGPRLSLR